MYFTFGLILTVVATIIRVLGGYSITLNKNIQTSIFENINSKTDFKMLYSDYERLRGFPEGDS